MVALYRRTTCWARRARATRSPLRRSTRGASGLARRCWGWPRARGVTLFATLRNDASLASRSRSFRRCSSRWRRWPHRLRRPSCWSITRRGSRTRASHFCARRPWPSSLPRGWRSGWPASAWRSSGPTGLCGIIRRKSITATPRSARSTRAHRTCNWRRLPSRRWGGRAERLLHIAAVLPSHGKQRFGNLAQRADSHRIHELRKDVFIADDRLLQGGQHGRAFCRVARMKGGQPAQLRLLFLLGGAGHLHVLHGVDILAAEGVDADEGQRPVMFFLLIQH